MLLKENIMINLKIKRVMEVIKNLNQKKYLNYIKKKDIIYTIIFSFWDISKKNLKSNTLVQKALFLKNIVRKQIHGSQFTNQAKIDLINLLTTKIRKVKMTRMIQNKIAKNKILAVNSIQGRYQSIQLILIKR